MEVSDGADLVALCVQHRAALSKALLRHLQAQYSTHRCIYADSPRLPSAHMLDPEIMQSYNSLRAWRLGQGKIKLGAFANRGSLGGFSVPIGV